MCVHGLFQRAYMNYIEYYFPKTNASGTALFAIEAAAGGPQKETCATTAWEQTNIANRDEALR